MRNFFLSAALLATLVGCGNAMFDDGMKKAVREKLKDPDSAKWEGNIKYKDFACIKYNAKNSYGGYGGSSWAVLQLLGGNNWYVKEMDATSCYESTLKSLSEKEEATKVAEATILGEFKKRKLIADSVQNSFDLPEGDCRTLMSNLRSYASLAIDNDEKEKKAAWKAKYDAALKEVDTVKCQ